MSSIYKKGRDGYYYYQTYVYNPESKKKDKRVFHALRTKDPIEAKTKQHKLDLQYEKQNQTDPNSLISSYNFGFRPMIVIVVGTIAITILLNNYFRSDNIKLNTNSSIISEKPEVTKKNDVISKNIEPVKSVINDQVNYKKENRSEISKANIEQKVIKHKATLPKYTVERVDILSNAFNQGKIYVTINENSDNQSQRLLCKNLAKKYSEFSNIIICLYANNRVGKDLANGKDETVSVEEQKRYWLAMYTYNSVEGEYFDENPSGYLGIN